MGAFLIYTGCGVIIGGCIAWILAFIILSGKDE